MNKVERFFHIRTAGKTHGGVTIRVVGDVDNPGQVDVQYTQCSPKDAFCRKTGRDIATKAPIKVVPLRYLPNELARIQDKAMERDVDLCNLAATPEPGADYTFSIKYFLPKE